MQRQNLDKAANGGAFTGLLPAQALQQGFIGRRPALAPLAQRLGMLKGPGSLRHQCQVVERIQDVLLATVTALVRGNDLVVGQQLDA